MPTLIQKIDDQQQTIANSRAAIAQRNRALKVHVNRRVGSPLAITLGFGGGLVLGLRREAFHKEDAKSVLEQGLPIARMILTGYLMGRG